MQPNWGATAARSVSVTALALALVLVGGTASADEVSRWESGRHLYDKVCGHCHKPEVGVGTRLEGRELPLDYLRFVVRNGLNGMPAFPASFVDDESLGRIAQYLATLPSSQDPG